MQVDIVILSNGKTEELRKVTQQSIDTCIASDPGIDFNIIVIEQNEDAAYRDCNVYYCDDPFNYNKFLNKGVRLGTSPFICLCNNDLIFHTGWASTIIEAMKKYNLPSACPVCPHVQPHRLSPMTEEIYFGYRNSYEMSGWCIMIRRDIMKIIGKIDEEFPFWFADNAYAEQLKSFNIPHGLVTKAVVEHIGSKTLNTLDKAYKDSITMDDAKRFVERHPNNESAIHFKQHLGL